MLYGSSEDGNRIEASPGAQAHCAGCKGPLIAKCGSVNKWHWAHRSKDCDSWHEPEGAWHLGWKSMAPKEWTEVVMGPHRADIRRDDGLVIELQASTISAEEIVERENFYGRMIWLLDGRDFNFNVEKCGGAEACCVFEGVPTEYYCTSKKPQCSTGKHRKTRDLGWYLIQKGSELYYMKHTNAELSGAYWGHRRRSFDSALAPIFIDLGFNGVYQIKRVQYEGPKKWRFDGFYHSRQEFAAAARLTWRDDALSD